MYHMYPIRISHQFSEIHSGIRQNTESKGILSLLRSLSVLLRHALLLRGTPGGAAVGAEDEEKEEENDEDNDDDDKGDAAQVVGKPPPPRLPRRPRPRSPRRRRSLLLGHQLRPPLPREPAVLPSSSMNVSGYIP